MVQIFPREIDTTISTRPSKHTTPHLRSTHARGIRCGWATTQICRGNAWKKGALRVTAERISEGQLVRTTLLWRFFPGRRNPSQLGRHARGFGKPWSEWNAGDRRENLRNAINMYKLTLEVFNCGESQPVRWATTQIHLGNAFYGLQKLDDAVNLQEAIGAYMAALEMCTRETNPGLWATTQHNLGTILSDITTGDRGENQDKALKAFQAALEVRTFEGALRGLGRDSPQSCYLVGCSWRVCVATNAASYCGAQISSSKAALTVRTADDFPREHAATVLALQLIGDSYDVEGCSAEVPFNTIPPASSSHYDRLPWVSGHAAPYYQRSSIT